MKFSEIAEKRMGQRDIQKTNTTNTTIGVEFEVSCDLSEAGEIDDVDELLQNFADERDLPISSYLYKFANVIELLDAHQFDTERLRVVDLEDYRQALMRDSEHSDILTMPEDTHEERKSKLVKLLMLNYKASREDAEGIVNKIDNPDTVYSRIATQITKAIGGHDDFGATSITYILPADEDDLLQAKVVDMDDINSPEEVYDVLNDIIDVSQEEIINPIYDGYWDFVRDEADKAGYNGRNDPLTYVGDLIEPVVGRVEVSHKSSSGGRSRWTVEPDSSIAPSDTGAEIVSPVMTYQESMRMISDVLDVLVNDPCISTNSTTGLHVNIGTFDPDKIDLLKFLTFMNDRYLGSVFGRLNTSYAQTYYDTLAGGMGGDLNKDNMITRLNNAIINTGKYQSVNFRHVHDGYLEVRIMGGENYHHRKDEIINAVGRLARCLEIALDPSAYRNEYLKKVSKFVEQISTPHDNHGGEIAKFPALLTAIQAKHSYTVQSMLNNMSPAKYLELLIQYTNRNGEEEVFDPTIRTKLRSEYVRYVKSIEGYSNTSTIRHVADVLSLSQDGLSDKQDVKFVQQLAKI